MSASAQTENLVLVRDLESWSKVGISKQFGENFKMKLYQEMRLNNNSSALDQLNTDLSAGLKVNKWIGFGAGMRYIYRKSGSGDFENHLRFNFDLNAQHEWNRFTFDYRLRYQFRNELGYSRDEGDFLLNGERLKAGFEYDIKKLKLDPIFSIEIFRQSGKYILPSFNKIRFTLGTEYKIKKIGELGMFYRIERELGVSYPMTTHIIGANFTFKLK